jgi:hypothetical protein
MAATTYQNDIYDVVLHYNKSFQRSLHVYAP